MATHGSSRMVLLILMTLTAIFSLAKCTQESHQVDFYQVDEGPRSIGSNVTIVSNVTTITPCARMVIDFSLRFPTATHHNFTYLGAMLVEYKECGETKTHFARSAVPHLHISNVVNHGSRTRLVMWHFSNLPESYDGMQLSSIFHGAVHTTINNIALTVLACKSYVRVGASRQNASYTITPTGRAGNSRSVRFQDLGICNCTGESQLLFHTNGTRADGVARCAYNAIWTGCENLQCWSAPRNLTIIQLNRTVGSQCPFDCTYTDGFPASHEIRYKINNVTLPSDYKLRSSDNGQSLSCEVISNYSLATGEKPSSAFKDIIVYYPPEKSFLSVEFASVHLNSTKILHFVFFANPSDGRIRLNIEDAGGQGNDALLSRLFLLKEYYSEHMIHIYAFEMQVTSSADYCNYNICASTSESIGRSCSQFILSSPPRAHYYGTPSFLIAIAATVVLLCILCCIGLFLVLRSLNSTNPRSGTEKNSKAFRSNSDEYAEYEIKSYDAEYEETTPAPLIYENTEPRLCYEEVH